MKRSLFAVASLFAVGAVYANGFDIVTVQLPTRTTQLYGCTTHYDAHVGLSANCQGGVTSFDRTGPNIKDAFIDFAVISTNFEWFEEVGGRCLFVEKHHGMMGEMHYTVNCGDEVFHDGFERYCSNGHGDDNVEDRDEG